MTDEMQRSLGRLESKVDLLIDRTDKYDERLGAVEKKVWWASGVAAAIGFISSHLLGKH